MLRSPRLRLPRLFSVDQLLLLLPLRLLRSAMAEAGACQTLLPLLQLSARSRSAVAGGPSRGDAGVAAAAGARERKSVPLKASLRASTVPLRCREGVQGHPQVAAGGPLCCCKLLSAQP